MMYLTVNASNRFEWVAPWLPSGSPALTVPELSISETLAPVLPQRTITAVASDLRTLTVSVAVSAGGTGEYGAVFVDLGSAGRFLARVEAIEDDTTVRLVNPLPLGAGDAPDPGSSTMTLNWLTYYIDLAAGDVGATVTRNARWLVTWSQDMGAIDPKPARSRGLLSLVPQEPDTGLDHFTLIRHYPRLSGLGAAGASSYAPQIARAMGELVDMVHPTLPTGRYIDQVDFAQWMAVHEHLTIACILEDDAASGDGDETTIAQARHHRGLAQAGFNARSTIAWLDSDDDGAAESKDVAAVPLTVIGYGLDTLVDDPDTDPYAPDYDYEGDI